MTSTRVFIFFLAFVGSLLVGITWTVMTDVTDGAGVAYVSAEKLTAAVSLDEDYTVADEEDSPDISTEEILQETREKIMAYREAGAINGERFIVREGEPESIVSPATPDESSIDEQASVASAQRCAGYQEFAGVWPTGLRIDEQEGARLVYHRKSVSDNQTATSADASTVPRDVLLQLPMAQQPGGGTTCLATDVVGIAQDGSLIRNAEYDLYGIFTDETVVGYALDGFPIFGRNDSVSVDECGGAMVRGQYGYVLQSDRDSVVQCFRGRPTPLPVM